MSLTNWHEDAAVNGWNMPLVPRWWRWWGVRHVRWAWADMIESDMETGFPNITRPYDRWVMFGVWHGMDKGADE